VLPLGRRIADYAGASLSVATGAHHRAVRCRRGGLCREQIGAGGNLGMGGGRCTYTILFATSSHVVNPNLFSKVPILHL
jgi:hypothetical protein